tara:strand:- start:176 stop:919 length:744 start_codon:yes stop_codon:yes gene_type:complete
MKISIITVVYNGAKTIFNNIKSVNNQTYPDIEHIFIDGFSTDNSLNIIKSESKRDSKFISELDNGIYDAMNKGVKIANGDFILFLNSDDIFYSDTTVYKIVEKLTASKADVLYGNIFFISNQKTVRKWIPGEYVKNKNKLSWHPPHPGLTVRKEIFYDVGLFDTSFSLSADYDFILKLLKSNNYNFCYLNEVLVNMSVGGVTTTISGMYHGVFQIFRSHRKNGDSFLLTLLILFNRYKNKIIQTLNK